MTTTTLTTNEFCVYPGEYIHSPETKTLISKLKAKAKRHISNKLLHMNEYKDCFKLEMIVAGIKREDIIIQIKNDILSIILVGKFCGNVKKKFRVHQFDTDFIEQQVLLPKNADIEFIIATCKEGLLYIYIPKASHSHKKTAREVVVY